MLPANEDRPRHIFPIAGNQEPVEAIEAPILIHEHRNLDVTSEWVDGSIMLFGGVSLTRLLTSWRYIESSY